MPAGAHAAGSLPQQAVGRQAEIQAMLQHHHVGSMFAQGPGLLLANNLDPGQGRAQAHVALHLPRLGRRLGAGAIVHQITTEVAPQFIFEQALLFMQ
ncbi:hypothetical protein D9M71_699250 [compost metagenome]